jgi:Rrf2 family iron-sulfur cluster assembly transcriptional regulator
MLYSHGAEVAIRAAIYLASRPDRGPCPVHEIARVVGLPGPYLAKVVRRMAEAGIVRAYRGPGGGVELTQPADGINLWSIVQAVEGRETADPCVLGLGACSAENPCPLHSSWAPLRAEFQKRLEETTLAHLREHYSEWQREGKDRWTAKQSDGSSKLAPRLESHGDS